MSHSHHGRADAVLYPWRAELFTSILRIALVAGVPVLVPGVIAAFHTDVPIIAISNITVYLLVIPVYYYRKRYYTASVITFSLLLLALGAVLLLVAGIVSAAMLWLMMPPALAGLLLGRRAYTFILGAILILAAGVTISLHLGFLSWQVPMSIWLTVVGSFLLIVFALTTAVRYLFVRITTTLSRELRLNETLTLADREKDSLLREIHHRVRNNLQLINSLISLQKHSLLTGEARRVLSIMENRINTMALAYGYLNTDHGGLRVDLNELIRIISEENGYHNGIPISFIGIAGESEVRLEQATLVALAVTEILEVSREYLVPSVAVSVHDKRFSVTLAREELGAMDIKPIPAITRDILEALAQQAGGMVSFSDSTRKIVVFIVPLNTIPPGGSTRSNERD